MRQRKLKNILGLAVAGLLASSAVALACEAEKMMTTDAGFIFKVVGGSDKVEVKKDATGGETGFTMDLLQPYFVICEEGDFYKITDLQAESVAEAEKGKVGYVLKGQVFAWPTREALNFSPLIKGAERPEIMAWADEKTFNKFLDTLDAKLAPPAFRENRDTTLKRENSIRPYPVLSSADRTIAGSTEKRTFDVLLPAVLPPDAKAVFTDPSASVDDLKNGITDTLTAGTFVIAFDVTASMGPFAESTAKNIRSAFEAMPPEIQEKTQIGFVFFRDEGDEEKIVISDPLPVKAASDALKEIAPQTSGGGDDPEPVLDATYVAGLLFPWDKTGQSSGRRVVISVLSDDAKPTTTGKIDDRVPVGMDATSLASELLKQNIQVITVQAGPNAGENLKTVLGTLATQTGGQFIEWTGGTDQADKISSALSTKMVSKRTADFDDGSKISKLITMYNGYPSIPMEVLDGTKLDDLRKAGINFNIESSKGGVLVTEGYMLENSDLLSQEIQVEKNTLQSLIKLFTALGIAGVDVEGMKKSAGEAIAAIAGEEYDAKEPISDTIKKKLGIQFRTKLLEFDLEYLAGMAPAERVAMAKRIQDAGDRLNNYLQAHLEEFDKTPAVWMPVDQLP